MLSGTGSDGTLGLKEVKGVGGMVMVQDAETAKYDGMPRSAISTGMVDFILSVEDMPGKLQEYVKRSRRIRVPETRQDKAIKAPDALDNILTLVRHRLGHDFTHYKRSTINRRIEKRMLVKNTDSLEGYYEVLDKDNAEVDALFKDLLIGVTSFFRDPEAFEFIEKSVVPRLFKGKKPDDPLRVWVTGCSTGEEAYTIAILLKEHMDSIKRAYDVQIFATDIDKQAIETARVGSYPESIAGDISPERLKRYFRFKDDRYTLIQSIREMIVFAPHDLLRDPPFFKLDMVSCRNLLIYMTSEIQKKILPLFFYSLNPGGHLLLGPSETVGQFTDLFQVEDKRWKAFKRNAVETKAPVDFPLSPRRFVAHGHETVRDLALNRISPSNVLERQLLRRYAHPAVLIDDKMDILYYFGDTSLFFTNPEGEPTENMIKKARRGLKLRLRTAVQKAVKSEQPVSLKDVKIDGLQGVLYGIYVEPISEPAQAKGLLFVVFEEQPARDTPLEKLGEATLDQDSMVIHLEEELKITSEELQNTIEELETTNEELKSSNEELMSMNEELQSSNEELETSKEELQALNEELTTVNAELNSKVDELQKAYSDIENLLASSNVATVFVDKKMIIRRFTPQAEEVFYLIDSDVGRPLQHVVNKLQSAGLIEDCQTVLKDLAWREKEVQTEDGKFFLMRLFPYRTVEDAIDGVVLTFVDITQRKQAEEELRLGQERLALALEASGAGVYDHSVPLDKATYHSAQWANILGYDKEELPPFEFFMSWLERHVHPEDREYLAQAYERFVSGETDHYDVEIRMCRKDGRYIWVRGMAKAVVRDTQGQAKRIVGLIMDVTEKKQLEIELERRVQERTRELRERELMLSTTLQSFPGGSLNVLDKDLRYVLAQGRDLKGVELVGKSYDELYDAEQVARVRPFYERAFQGETVELDIPFSGRWYHLIAAPLKREQGAVEHILVVARDVTEKKQAEEEIASLAKFPNENPHPVLRVGAEGNLCFANPSSQALLQEWKCEVGQAVPDDIAALVASAYDSGLIKQIDLPVGQAMFHVSFAPLEDRGYVNLYCLDITARKLAEERLKESEERFRSVVENIEEGFWIRTFPKERVIYTSPLADAVFGFPAGTIQNHPEKIIEAINEADRERVRTALQKLKEHGGPFDESYWITGQDGKNRFLKVQGIPLFNDEGRLCRMIGMAIDLTERKRLEESYQKASNEARAANQSKSEFLANMSHEIRTPLNGILGVLQLLEMKNLDEEQHEYVGMARSASEKLLRILSDILDLSRVEAGKLELFESEFGLRGLVDSIQGLFSEQAHQKGVSLTCEVAPDVPPVVFADEIRIRQLLFNLVGNAVKFTESGAIELSVSLLEKKANNLARLRFRVADTGVGMPPGAIERVFEPFIQADGSFTRRFKGSGLGLSIVKRLLEMMGGEIDITSAEGKGTEVVFDLTVSLGAESGEESAALEKNEHVLPFAFKPKVLLVEDEITNLKVAKSFLEQLGCEVHAASNGLEALERLQAEELDVIIMDVQMPVMDGVTAAREIRGNPQYAARSHIPIIALTAHVLKDERERFLEAGMNAHLGKPVVIEDLKKALVTVLEEAGHGE